MAQKRQDIQGIRGWAIALVVTFHFFPAYCPNGYLGVDMFLVISGFLMAMIITTMEMTPSSCQNFYYRRIKRILPLYYMISAAILLLVVLRLPSFRLINFPSSRKAIFLITNIRLSENDPVMDYEKMLSNADDLFTHTWSLCVEMQWYLLAPLLFFVQNLVPLRRATFFLGITCISLGFYLITDSNTAFYNTFARMWQFCVGIIAFLSSENLEKEASLVIKANSNSKIEEHRTNCIFASDFISWLLFILAILLPFFWHPLPKRFLRIETTMLTGILILLGKERKVSALTVQEVVFVGEISYALYLIHWPVLVIMEYYFPKNPLNPYVGVTVSFLLAMLVYRFYEKKYLQWSPPIVCFLIGVLFVGCAYLSSLSTENVITNRNIDYNKIKIEDAAWNLTLMRQLNAAEAKGRHLWHKECTYSGRFSNVEPPHGFCAMKNGNGRINILVAGNSFACNQGDIIYKAFKQYARQFNIFCIPRCEMFSHNCGISFNFTHVVEELKPEVVFMIDRAFTMKAPLNVSKPIDEDRVFGLFLKTLKFLEKTTKKVYILQALPSCIFDCAYKAVDYLRNGKALNTIEDGLIIKNEFFFFARHRIWEIGKRCKNCEIVDYMPVLVDKKGHYLGYDTETNLMYLDYNNHFNTFGKQRIQTVFDELARKFTMFIDG
ncbi:unnamed protein product [Cylicocyclus nassatus]|uniref:Acyltransferase n=1 Tax=Cylicocyclus nassatus TaxID=53992 RepID=A0AA36MD06_CYLNA|nr:unnamed protein product [Cylicocyclus nassatus]